jgi:phosphoserine phosphatase
VLAPNEYARLLLDPIYLEELVAKYDEIHVKGTCENITGRKYDINDIIKLKEFHETIKKTPQLLETSSGELLKEIQKELGDLNKNVEKAIDALKESGIVTKTKSEKAAEDAELLSRLKEMRDKVKQEG